jgi:hypothetical protein
LAHYYGGTRPTVVQVQTGRIHRAKIHDRTVYLTTGEYALGLTMHVIAIVAIGVFFGIALGSLRKDRAASATTEPYLL